MARLAPIPTCVNRVSNKLHPGVAVDKFTRWLGTHGSQAGAQACLWAEAGEQQELVRRWRERTGVEEVFFVL